MMGCTVPSHQLRQFLRIVNFRKEVVQPPELARY